MLIKNNNNNNINNNINNNNNTNNTNNTFIQSPWGFFRYNDSDAAIINVWHIQTEREEKKIPACKRLTSWQMANEL